MGKLNGHWNRKNFYDFLDEISQLLYDIAIEMHKRSTKWGTPPKGCYLFCAFFVPIRKEVKK